MVVLLSASSSRHWFPQRTTAEPSSVDSVVKHTQTCYLQFKELYQNKTSCLNLNAPKFLTYYYSLSVFILTNTERKMCSLWITVARRGPTSRENVFMSLVLLSFLCKTSHWLFVGRRKCTYMCELKSSALALLLVNNAVWDLLVECVCLLNTPSKF